MERLVVAGRHDPTLRPDLGSYTVESFLKMTGRPLQFVAGVRQQEGEEPLRAWLAKHSLQGTGSRFQSVNTGEGNTCPTTNGSS
jgi:hypothetical protein